jgi:hypothetical protein
MDEGVVKRATSSYRSISFTIRPSKKLLSPTATPLPDREGATATPPRKTHIRSGKGHLRSVDLTQGHL